MSYPQLAEGSWVQLKSTQLIDKITAEDQAGWTSVNAYWNNVIFSHIQISISVLY